MKRICLLPMLLLCVNMYAQNFGEFASAVFVGECGVTQFYNTSGSGANCINPSCGTLFNGQNFGTFLQNSGDLYIGGAEIKTWKNAGGNVCGANLNYRVYPTGSPSGAFSSFSLPFKANCCGANFCDGLGPCGGNDQKWSQEALIPSVDLTTFAPGNWSVEVYISYFGDDFSASGCGMTRFISNGGVNFVANYTIVGSGSHDCALLAADLNSLSSVCEEDFVKLEWDITPDHLTHFIALEKSVDAVHWDEIFRSQEYQTTPVPLPTHFEDRSFPSTDVYYRLVEYETTGNVIYFDVISNQCKYENETYSISNSIGEDGFLVVHGNNSTLPLEVSIFDAMGKTVYQKVIEHNGQESAMYQLDDFDVASGLFIARITRFGEVLEYVRFLR